MRLQQTPHHMLTSQENEGGLPRTTEKIYIPPCDQKRVGVPCFIHVFIHFHTSTTSHHHILTPSHHHTLTVQGWLLYTFSYIYNFTPSHPHSRPLYTFSTSATSHSHTLTSSHPHSSTWWASSWAPRVSLYRECRLKHRPE